MSDTLLDVTKLKFACFGFQRLKPIVSRCISKPDLVGSVLVSIFNLANLYLDSMYCYACGKTHKEFTESTPLSGGIELW